MCVCEANTKFSRWLGQGKMKFSIKTEECCGGDGVGMIHYSLPVCR